MQEVIKANGKQLTVEGTPFQLTVWKSLLTIPKGELRTYKQMAELIGKPSAVRAVANAIGKNPYPIDIPCHRVIRTDGGLGGFSMEGGVTTKKKLLKAEGHNF